VQFAAMLAVEVLLHYSTGRIIADKKEFVPCPVSMQR
jgi:hypothetical protein